MQKLVEQTFETQKQLYSQLLQQLREDMSKETVALLKLAIDLEMYPGDSDAITEQLRQLTYQQVVDEPIAPQTLEPVKPVLVMTERKKKSRGFDGGAFTFGYEVIEEEPADVGIAKNFIFCERSGDAFEMAEDIRDGKSYYAGCGVVQNDEGKADVFFSQVRVKGSH